MKCLLIILDLDSGSGTCSRLIAQELLSRGHSVVILTRDAHTELGIDVVNYNNRQRKKNRFLLSIKRILLYPIWPYLSLRDYLQVYKHAKEIIVSRGIDVLITVYNPIEAIKVGADLKKEFPHLVFIPYFLDALLAGPSPKFMPGFIKNRRAIKLENKLLCHADSVVMMKAAENVYVKNRGKIKNYNSIVFLDLPLFKPQVFELSSPRKHFSDDQVVLFYAGALPLNIRNPKCILEIVSRCAGSGIHLYLAGSGDYDSLLNDFSSKSSNIHILGVQDYTTVQEMYREANFLVSIGNSLSYMVPSKIFEYMSFGKPIIATVKIPEDPSLPYLNEYNNMELLFEVDDFETNISKLLSFVRSAYPRTCSLDAFRLNRPSTFVDSVVNTYRNYVGDNKK